MFCCFWTDLVSVWTAWGIRSKKIVIHSNGLCYVFGKNCRPFEQLGHPFPPKLMSSVWTAWVVRLEKIVFCSNGLGYPFQKIVMCSDARAIGLKKKLSTVGGTEPVCSKINFSRISIPKPFHRSHSCQTICYSPCLVHCTSQSLFTNLSWMVMDLCSFVAIFAFI